MTAFEKLFILKYKFFPNQVWCVRELSLFPAFGFIPGSMARINWVSPNRFHCNQFVKQMRGCRDPQLKNYSAGWQLHYFFSTSRCKLQRQIRDLFQISAFLSTALTREDMYLACYPGYRKSVINAFIHYSFCRVTFYAGVMIILRKNNDGDQNRIMF